MLVTAFRGSLYVKSSDGNLQAPGPLEGEETLSADDIEIPNILFEEEEDEDEEKKGMSSGKILFSLLEIST